MAINRMKEQWQLYSDKFNNRQLRERALILVSCLAFIYLIWDWTIATPAGKKRTLLENRYQQTQRALDQVSIEESVLVKTLTDDPNSPKQRELLRLENEVKDIEEKLQKLSVGLLPAEHLPKVIYDVLVNTRSVKITRMKNNPVTELLLDNVGSDAEENVDELDEDMTLTDELELIPVQGGVYKHSVTVGIQGKYFEIRDYLKALEGLPWTLYWQMLDYQVSKYPSAQVTLEVFTLSTERGVFSD